MDEYLIFLMNQLRKTLKRTDDLLATIDLDDFCMDADDLREQDTLNADDENVAATDLDAFLKFTMSKQLIRHAIDLSDVIVDDLLV